MCRSCQADPDKFGIFDMHGLWFIRGNLVRDLLALNKIELLPWDGWGLTSKDEQDISPDDLALLDRIADLTRVTIRRSTRCAPSTRGTRDCACRPITRLIRNTRVQHTAQARRTLIVLAVIGWQLQAGQITLNIHL